MDRPVVIYGFACIKLVTIGVKKLDIDCNFNHCLSMIFNEETNQAKAFEKKKFTAHPIWVTVNGK